MTLKFGRRAVVAAVAALSFANPVFAGGHQVVDSIHFLIPGGAGGARVGLHQRDAARRLQRRARRPEPHLCARARADHGAHAAGASCHGPGL